MEQAGFCCCCFCDYYNAVVQKHLLETILVKLTFSGPAHFSVVSLMGWHQSQSEWHNRTYDDNLLLSNRKMILQKVISVSDLAKTCLGWAVTFIQKTNKCDTNRCF